MQLDKLVFRGLPKRFFADIEKVVSNTWNVHECDCFSFAISWISEVHRGGHEAIINLHAAKIYSS